MKLRNQKKKKEKKAQSAERTHEVMIMMRHETHSERAQGSLGHALDSSPTS